MIDHFEIKTVKFKQCKAFYSTVLVPLGIESKWGDDSAAGFGLSVDAKVQFLIEKFEISVPSHIAFIGKDENAVQQFYSLGIGNGYECNGKPGLRTNYAANYYAAFLIDPDGKNVEAVAHL